MGTVTVNINELSLCHRGSGGISRATLPDVCKTPGNAVPLPYPNIAFSRDLVQGTTSITADGGHMCAKYGSRFAKSIGDAPGSLGGVKSGTVLHEASWITYSFDVTLEGKGACRLTDKMWHNKANTVNAAGLMQAPLEAWPELVALCVIICACDAAPTTSASGASELKEQCVENTLRTMNAGLDGQGVPGRMRPEIPYNMTTSPPTPLLHRVPGGNTLQPTAHLPSRMAAEGLRPAAQNGGIYQVRVPDVVIARAPDASAAGAAGSLTAPNLKAVVEIKFNNQPRDPAQIAAYTRIAGGDPNRVIELSPRECQCQEPDPRRVLVRQFNEEAARRRVTSPFPLTPSPVPAAPGVFDLKYWEQVTGLTGIALILLLIVWQGSRLFPPRNLVPI
ncbi:MAG: DUF4150 domain-containing protein [Gemmatimonadaceae bacterium]|nr:DUF4150 domain-containing protein [Gemmatimonadaceae bacterium]